MPSRLIFLPIEPYQSRYTQYTSVRNGVYETCFKEAGIQFVSIRPDNDLRSIEQGQVLDVVSRTAWGFAQIKTLVEMITRGQLDPKEDVIYLEDFFTPGLEMIPYAQSSVYGPSLMDHTPVYSFCHAQSWDRYDFTYRWQWWLRPIEKMWMDYNKKVFCAAKEMLPLINDAGVPLTKWNQYAVLPVGHAFHKGAMLDAAGLKDINATAVLNPRRTKEVIFASRWDTEKNPDFFMDLIEEIMRERSDITFKICTGNKVLTTNSPNLRSRLGVLEYKFPKNIKIKDNLSLRQYYTHLRQAKVLFNCAFQDWISYVLLDATINGCAPLFPAYLSFPEALNNDPRFLYEQLNLQNAKDKLYALVDFDEQLNLSPIYTKYEDTVNRILRHMGFAV